MPPMSKVNRKLVRISGPLALNGAPEGFFRVQRKNPHATRADAGGAAAKPTCQPPARRRRPGDVCAAAQIGREGVAAPAAAVCGGGRSPASPNVGGGKGARVDAVDSVAQRTKLGALPPRERGCRQARHGYAAAPDAPDAPEGKGGPETRCPAAARPGLPWQRTANGADLVMTVCAGAACGTGAVSCATTLSGGVR